MIAVGFSQVVVVPLAQGLFLAVILHGLHHR